MNTATGLRFLPVFVYGTLRTNQGNWSWALQGRTVHEQPATLHGARMFDNSMAFPFVTMSDSTEADVVVGDLMWVREDLYSQVMADLDGLEGYRGEGFAHNMYDRKVVTVTTENGEQVEAYTYLVGATLYASRVCNYPVIVGGDWLAHLDAHGARRSRV